MKHLQVQLLWSTLKAQQQIYISFAKEVRFLLETLVLEEINLQREIQRTLNISYEEAERLKVGEGSDEGQNTVIPQEIQSILHSVCENVGTKFKNHRLLSFDFSRRLH